MYDSFATQWTVAHQISSVHGIFQARVLEWGAIAFSKKEWETESSQKQHPLWMWLVMEVKSDAVKNNIAYELEC